MSKDDDRFRRAIKYYGLGSQLVLARPDNLFAEQIKRANSLIESAHANFQRFPDVYFGLVDSPIFNAWAFKYDRHHFIAYSAFAIVGFHLLFNRMLADQSILTRIGDPNNESQNLPIFSELSGFGKREDGKIIMPLDPQRILFARHLRDMAISFLTCHELTHIANGHTDFPRKGNQSRIIPEFGFMPQSSSEALLLQTLEMDADCGATSAAIGTIRIKMTDPAKKALPPWDRFYVDEKECIFNWSFAVNSFFRSFGDTAISAIELSKTSHPPWRSRHMIAASTAATYVLNRWDKNLALELGPVLNDSMNQVEKAFSVITGKPMETTGLKEIWDGTGWAYAQTLINHWKSNLRSKLQPYAYCILPE